MKKLILLVLIVASVFTYIEVSNIGNQKVVKWKYIIQKGDTVSNLPTRLRFEPQRTFYKLWLKFLAPEVKLQAWTYSIPVDSILSEVFSKTLKKPDSLDQEITILPGWNIFDIDYYLSNKWVIKSWELIELSDNLPSELKSNFSFLDNSTSLEWFLYPDTYRLQFNIQLIDLVSVLLEEFNNKIYKQYWIKSWKEFYNKLILASIIQKEERNTINKPIVAWILSKRLEEWIALWADATVCYQYRITFNECTPAFIWEKIYIKSDYNTRNKLWLPPTPISNMTDDTFKSVFSSEQSPYYYYLHDMNGNIHYGRTLQEHVNNKNLYLK